MIFHPAPPLKGADEDPKGLMALGENPYFVWGGWLLVGLSLYLFPMGGVSQIRRLLGKD